MSKLFVAQMKASVIIPNWNGKNLLFDCLSSLVKQSFHEFEVILVDNGSTDDSLDFVKKEFPNVKIISLEKNYGFAKAINEGVKSSQAKYAIFLNNDTYSDKDWIKNLINCAESNSGVISINSKILNFYNRKKIDGLGISINEVGQAKSIGWEEEDLGQYENPIYLFGATGGGSLFVREDFVKLGMFDEDYFMYCEEVDFAFRAQFQGYKSIYCPKAILFHKHKATSSKRPQHIEYWQFRNMTQTIIKDFPANLFFKELRWLKIILVHLNTIFYQLKNGFIWPPLIADIWLITHIFKLLKKRAGTQRSRKVSDEYIESFFSDKKITFWGLLK